MSNLIDILNDMGCDMKSTLTRFLDDEEFYRNCYEDMLQDEGFDKLGKAIENHNVKEAFEYAHMLKGVVANLGITPIFDILVEIVDPLRIGSEEGVKSSYEKLMIEKRKFDQLIE